MGFLAAKRKCFDVCLTLREKSGLLFEIVNEGGTTALRPFCGEPFYVQKMS